MGTFGPLTKQISIAQGCAHNQKALVSAHKPPYDSYRYLTKDDFTHEQSLVYLRLLRLIK